MKRIAACLVVSGFAASSAMGGTVAFDLVVKDLNLHTYDVSVSAADFTLFNTVDLVMGSESPVGLSFVYDAGFVAGTTQPPGTPTEWFIYAGAGGHDVWAGGFNGNNTWSAPLLVGQLTVDTTGLREAAVVQVSSSWELANVMSEVSALGAPQSAPESLEGMIKIPEPATLMLLGFGGLAVLRRRKA